MMHLESRFRRRWRHEPVIPSLIRPLFCHDRMTNTVSTKLRLHPILIIPQEAEFAMRVGYHMSKMGHRCVKRHELRRVRSHQSVAGCGPCQSDYSPAISIAVGE